MDRPEVETIFFYAKASFDEVVRGIRNFAGQQGPGVDEKIDLARKC